MVKPSQQISRKRLIESKLQRAEQQLKSNQLKECRHNLEAILALNPQHRRASIELGKLYRQENRRQEAIECFQKVLKLSPKNLSANLNMAIALRESRLFTQAEKQLELALKHHQHDFDLLMEYAHLEQQRNQTEQALKWLVLAREQAVNPAQARATKLSEIEALAQLNRLDEAIEAVNLILEQWPNNLRAKLILGNLRLKKCDFAAAAEVYRDILQDHPQKILAHLELAKCLHQLGKTQEAISSLEKTQNFSQKDVRVLQKLGELYRHKADRQKALEYYQRALAIEPTNLGANLNVAIELRDTGLLDEAQQQLEKAQANHPQNLDVLLQFGYLEKKRQQLNLALDYFQKAKNSYPQKLKPCFGIIEVLSSLGRLDEAQEFLAQLHQEYPDNPSLLIQSGYLERKRGYREKALGYFRLAAEKSVNPTQKLKAQISAIEELRGIGLLEEAVVAIDGLLAQLPDNIRCKMLKGSILQKKLALTPAKNLYSQILKAEPNHLNARIELARTYSQLSQVETAIDLLKETQELLGYNTRVLMLLGSLTKALENREAAYDYYQQVCVREPYNIYSHCALADVMFLQGEIESAIILLEEAQARLPHGVQILIKLGELHRRLGNIDLGYSYVEKGYHLFPDHVPLLWQLCRVHIEQGNYQAAVDVLDLVSTDNRDWISQTEELKSNIAFNQYDYQRAEHHLNLALSNSSTATSKRNMLAFALLLTGRIEAAREQLKLATEEFELKTPVGKTIIPLKSHPAMIINALRINPPLMAQLEATQKETGYERLLALARLMAIEPNYLGTALYLARELRHQGVFSAIRDRLAAEQTNSSSIPKRIVQFWDEPTPPTEVQKICQSWIDFNPEYEYIRFSLDTAILFLKEHYDPKVLQAFKRCDQAATQADFFRLAYLSKMGGFYADADDLCRKSLDVFVSLNPELVLHQESLACCFGNNFLGCIPGQRMIRTAFYQAVNNLLEYYNDGPWLDTGPGLITCSVCSGLLPYLTYKDYQMWPRLLVLSQAELRKVVIPHLSLPYKRTTKSWLYDTYHSWIRHSDVGTKELSDTEFKH